MLRFVLWCVVAWLLWKIIRGFGSTRKDEFARRQSPKPSDQTSDSFHDIEDADFEDLTSKERKKE